MLLLQTTFLVGLTVVDGLIVVAKLAETVFLSKESVDLTFSKNLTLRCFCSCWVVVEDSWSCCWINRLVVVVLVVGVVVEVAEVVEMKVWISGVWEENTLGEVVSCGAFVVT